MDKNAYQNYHRSVNSKFLDEIEKKLNNANSKIIYPDTINVVKLGMEIETQLLQIRSGEDFEVHVSEAASPSHFWLLTKEDYLQLFDFMELIQEDYYNEEFSSQLKIAENWVKPNMYCVALYGDEFSRGMVRKVKLDEHKAEIIFIDYGTVSWVNSNELYFLITKYGAIEQFSIESKLAGILPVETTWSDEAISVFKTLTNFTIPLTANFCKAHQNEQPLEVDLKNDQGVSLTDILVKKGLAVYDRESQNTESDYKLLSVSSDSVIIKEDHPQEIDSFYKISSNRDDLSSINDDVYDLVEISSDTDTLEEDKINLNYTASNIRYPEFFGVVELGMDIAKQFVNGSEGDEFAVHVSEATSPSHFGLLTMKNYLELFSFMEHLQEDYYNKEISRQLRIPEDWVQPNLYCVALYGDEFSRGLVKNVMLNEHKAEIDFIDYRCVSWVDSRKLYFLITKFGIVGQFSIASKLSGICPADKSWSEEAIKEFKAMADFTIPLTAKLCKVHQDNQVLEVELKNRENGKSLNDILVSKGLAVYQNKKKVTEVQNIHSQDVELFNVDVQNSPEIVWKKDIQGVLDIENFKTGDYIEFRVFRIRDPFRLNAVLDKNIKDLENLTKELQNYGENSLNQKIPVNRLEVNMCCVALLQNIYRRGYIKEVDLENNEVQIFFYDVCCSSTDIDYQSLYYLNQRLASFPRLSFNILLENVPPVKDGVPLVQAMAEFLKIFLNNQIFLGRVSNTNLSTQTVKISRIMKCLQSSIEQIIDNVNKQQNY